MQTFLSWVGRALVGLVAFGLVSLICIMIYQRFSDGPTGPLAGGAFTSGEPTLLPTENWAELQGDFEFELVGEETSRTAGGVLVDGEVVAPFSKRC